MAVVLKRCSNSIPPNLNSISFKAHTISDLSDDVLFEIFILLPCKFVLRCKSVSKQWFLLISNPNFTRRFIYRQHCLYSQQNCSFIFEPSYFLIIPKVPALEAVPLEQDFSLKFLGPDFEPFNKGQICGQPKLIGTTILGSSSDLILCSKPMNRYCIYCICNPITKQWIKLPPALICSAHYMMGFICDSYYHIEEKEVVLKTSQQRRFRVVHIPRFSGTKYVFQVEVFSSEIGRWSLIDVSCSKGFTCFLACSMGVAYNGRLYFLNANGTLVYNPYGVDTIQQQCHSIDFPISFTYKSKALACLGLSCGYLRLSQFSSKHYDGEDSVLVWELKDFGNETRTGTWQLMHKICFNPEIWNGFDIHRQILEPAGKIYYPVVLSFHPYNSNIMYIQYTDVVFSCNLLTQTLEIVSDGDNSMSSPLNAPYANQYAKKAFPIVLPWWPTPIPYCDRVCFQY